MGFEHAAALWPIPSTCQTPNTTNISIQIRDAFLSWWAATPGPRFAVLSFEAAHAPWSYPPLSLLPPGYPIKSPGSPLLTNRVLYEAELVGADTAIGSILSVLDDGDVRIVMGDNGTPGADNGSHAQDATRDDQDPEKVKLTCFEDGVRIPFIVAGPGIPAGVENHALGSVIDILPTLLQFCGIPQAQPLDGVAGPHDLVFCWGGQTLDSAIIGARWKLHTENDGTEELYDLQTDPHELLPLPAIGPVAAFMRTRRLSILGH